MATIFDLGGSRVGGEIEGDAREGNPGGPRGDCERRQRGRQGSDQSQSKELDRERDARVQSLMVVKVRVTVREFGLGLG